MTGSDATQSWDDLIVLWGNSPWDGQRLGAQFLATALAERGPVLYVDPPLSLGAAAREGPAAVRAALASPRVTVLGTRLARVSPLAPPGKTRRGVRRVAGPIARRDVRRAVDVLGARSVRAVISGYLYADPFGCCDERWRIFRSSDDFSVGAELGIPVRYTSRAELERAAAADAIAAVSPVLVDRWRARGHRTVLIPNGCDIATLRDAAGLPPPPDVAVRAPIVGYVGQLSTRIDLRLLEAVAAHGHSLLLVGAMRSDLDPRALQPLLAHPNVQWVGHRPADALPAYLGAMHVGLLPYRASAFNRASFPLKLLEYLGAGLATVATDLPAVRWLGSDAVQVADGAGAFADEVERAIAGAGDDAARRRRVEIAASHSWADRAAAYHRLLDELDAGRVSS